MVYGFAANAPGEFGFAKQSVRNALCKISHVMHCGTACLNYKSKVLCYNDTGMKFLTSGFFRYIVAFFCVQIHTGKRGGEMT